MTRIRIAEAPSRARVTRGMVDGCQRDRATYGANDANLDQTPNDLAGIYAPDSPK